jgi:hypothetical protein
MWIPKPIYDHTPTFWLLLGLLFLAGGIFLNFVDALRIAYFVFAAFCCGHAVWTFLARRRFRQQAELESIDQRSTPVKSTES